MVVTGSRAVLAACLAVGLGAAGCADSRAEARLPADSVVVDDPVGDGRGGPGRLGSEAGQPPPGADLARVVMTTHGEHLSVAFESTEPIAAQSPGETVRSELQRGWWWVRFWESPDDEEPAYLLSVSSATTHALEPLAVVMCDLREHPYCSQGTNLLDASQTSVDAEGARLTVSIPVHALEDLRAPFQWAALTTLNETHARDNDWWDFVPDWPRGDRFQVSPFHRDEESSDGVKIGDAADAERRREFGPPHPQSGARAWFPPTR